jgi:uncharacterized protein YjdB
MPICEALEPWLPTLHDILYKGQYGTVDEQAYYSQFGLDQVSIPVDCVRVTRIMPRAVEMFNERFALRMVNKETLETWQIGLQTKVDEIVYKYERALEVYETNASEMNNVLEKKVIQRDSVSEDSGSDSTIYGRTDTFAGTVKTADTPNGTINMSDNYADAVSKNDNSNTASGTDVLQHGLINTYTDTVTETKEPEGGIVQAANRSIDEWRDIVARFVREFENNFLNIFWY